MRTILFLVAATLILSGCTSVISHKSRNLIDPSISFQELRGEPEKYNGRFVMLGGSIVSVKNKNDTNEMELVQLQTDERGKIIDTSSSGGRFIALSSSFLDPAIYKPGLFATMVGEVRGKFTKPLGETTYTYPVLLLREIHLWKPEEAPVPPDVHFGFGFGTFIH